MKKITAFMAALCCLSAMTVHAEGTEVTEDTEVSARGRVSAGFDYKFAKIFNVYAEEELRIDENFSNIDRLHGTVGLSCKATDWLKVAVNYNPIVVFKKDAADQWRHRVSVDVTGSYKWSQFKFSLRERLQLTRKMAYENPYQEPAWKVALRSRFKMSYDFHTRWEPYMSVELRHYLNSPDWTYNDSGAVYNGYRDAYMDRVRTMLGVEYAFNKENRLDIYLMYDYDYTIDYDANKKGTKLKGVSYLHGHYLTLGLAYTFKL